LQDDTASDPASTRIPLPSWIANVLELRICKYVSEHEKWQSSIEKRAHIGKALTKSQNERYQAWLADSVQRLVFNKKRQSYVSEARQITKDCIGIHLHLSDQPESLCVSVGAGADDGKFRLVLLKQNSLVVFQTIPDVLDQPLPPQALVEAGRDNDHDEGSGGEVVKGIMMRVKMKYQSTKYGNLKMKGSGLKKCIQSMMSKAVIY